ncbi:MAG: ABC-type spermidine/spermine transporter, ATP-binding protein [Fibrobacteres bacterium]|nr:ABC-type spermidine/spermine transporter, ATP-binding protein [Fibrobacterota bacterium]
MIEVKGIGKTFGATGAKSGKGGNTVLRDVDLAIADGEFFCLLGPSGCGKTTLLRIIAGLETPDAGRVSVGGRDVTREQPHKRGCALVFQNYALWPHLTVGENITYGLEVQGRPKSEIRSILAASLRSYQLEGLEGRHPHQLSGGQQQRVALARAMAVGPHAVLMDEPLSNLDAALRKSLRRELLEFHRGAGSTILYVTHDQEEALALADRIGVMMDGRILELGKPADLYARPGRLETALFLGDMNVMRGGDIPAFLRAGAEGAGKSAAALCIRPENIIVRSRACAETVRIAGEKGTGDGPGNTGNPGNLEGTLAFVEFMGTHATLGVDTASGRLLARVGTLEAQTLRPGRALGLGFPPEHLLWY